MNDDSAGNSHSDSSKAAQIEALVFDHLQRRLVGEDVDDQALLTEHPELMPELGEHLRLLGELNEGGQLSTAASAPSTRHTPALKIRCPDCQQSVDVSVDSSLTDVRCDSCGSHFSLLANLAETQDERAVKWIGRFELSHRLGAGSFGTVWQARDTELDRIVAIKVPRREKLGQDQVEQFLREARAAAQLNHPNIVAVHEVGRDAETVFIVSDLVRGVPLSDWLTSKTPNHKQAAELCETIARALDHAHQNGVVHRDLKPQNIIMGEDGEPHLTDFGLARRDVGEVTVTLDGHVLGTPAYMSPEQARGEAHAADRRTDIYSLGVILFEMLTGELPFKGSTRMLLHQVITEDAPLARNRRADIPRDLETICQTCMQKEPERRYASAAGLAEDLRRYLRDEPIHARPVSLPERAWRVCKRNRVQTGLAALVVVLTLAITANWLLTPDPPVTLDTMAVVLKSDDESPSLRDELSRNLIGRLSNVSALSVTSRSNVVRYQQDDVKTDSARIGRRLDVKAILSGEVRSLANNDMFDVNLELTRVDNGQRLWSQQSSVRKVELFGFETGIVRRVVERLEIVLTNEEQRTLDQPATQNQESLIHYLNGRALFNRYTESELRAGVREFQRAIELSPGFSEAHAGLAACYFALGYNFLDPKEWLEKAEAEVTRTLQLDDTIIEARVIQGTLNYFLHWRWQEAERVLKDAIERDASLVETHSCYLHAMAALGRPEGGVDIVYSALKKQPDSIALRWELGCALYYARRFSDSLAAYEAARKDDPENSFFFWGVGRAYNQVGNYQRAISVLEEGMTKKDGQWSGLLAELAYGYAKYGQIEEARQILHDLKQRESEGEFVDPYIYAMIHVGIGDTGATIKELNKALDVRSTWLPSLNTDAKFDEIREHPQMQSIVDQLGFFPER